MLQEIRPAGRLGAWRGARRAVAVAAMLATWGGQAAGTGGTVTWVGPNDSFWDLQTNWSSALPGELDNVWLGSANTVLRSNVSVRSLAGTGRLTLSGAVLSRAAISSIGALDIDNGSWIGGAGDLTVSGASNWGGATIAGEGSTFFRGTLQLSGNAHRTVNGGEVIFSGTTTWTNKTHGFGTISVVNGAQLVNRGTFHDNLQFHSSIGYHANSSGSTFFNQGVYSKNTSSTTRIGIRLDNTGTVQVNGGTLDLMAGGASTGVFEVRAGSLQFSGGTHAVRTIGSGNGGTGRVTVAGGTVDVADGLDLGGFLDLSGGAFNLNATQAGKLVGLSMTGGTLGGTGRLDISGSSTWTGGTMSGGGTSTIGGTLALSGDGLRSIAGRGVDFTGQTTWTNTANGSGGFTIGPGGHLFNRGTFNDQLAFDSAISSTADPLATGFTNAGSYVKSGAGTTTIAAGFENQRSVQVLKGMLDLRGGGASTAGGTFSVSSGATLRISGGTYSLTDKALSGPGRLSISGGTLELRGEAGAGGFEMTGGTLGGAGTLYSTGVGVWTGGTMLGTGTTTLGGSLALSAGSTRTVSGRRVDFTGTTVLTNGRNNEGFALRDGAMLVNSGVFLDQSSFNSTFGVGSGAPSVVVNTGHYIKSGSFANTTSINAGFDNRGQVVVDIGTLRLSGGGRSSGGRFDVADGAILSFSTGQHILANTVLAVDGTLAIDTGSLEFDRSMMVRNFEMASGTLSGTANFSTTGLANWTRGTMSGVGSTTLGGQLVLSGGGSRSVLDRTVDFAGTTTWSNTSSGGSSILTGHGATLTNSGSFNDQLAFDSGISNTLGGGASRFVNSGSYTKTGAGTTSIGIPVDNSGSFSVSSGKLVLAGGLSSFDAGTLTGGSYMVQGGAALQINGTDIQRNAASVVLEGSGSSIRSADTASALANFNTNLASGSFTVRNGSNLNLGHGFLNEGWLTIGSGSTFSTFQRFTNNTVGQVLLQGGRLQSLAGLTNAGRLAGFGNIIGRTENRPGATVRASGGNLTLTNTLLGDAGRLEIAEAASLTLQGSVMQAGVLLHEGTSFELGTGDLTVFQDYGNAAFGHGNGFDRRARVSGSGRILAAGSTQQTISGDRVQNGATTSAVLVLPNSRVGLGGASGSFVVNNTGSGGPSLRGALQTAAITDPALSGSGVTAQNWGPLVQGGAGASFTVNYAPTSGGALSGQVLQIVNNFDNVAPQTLTIIGRAFNPAKASAASPDPVVLAPQRLNTVPLMQSLQVSNLAPDGGFSERLNGRIAATSGDALASGSFNLLAAGASSGSLRVGLSTAAAGARSGIVTLGLVSDGTDSSRLAPLALAAQQVVVQGDVYRLANPVVAVSPVNLAARLGDAAPTSTIGLINASPDAYTERLNARFTGAAPAGFGLSGQVNGLVAGAGSTALVVSLDTANAGSFSGTANLAFVSSGAGTTLLPDRALANGAVALHGRVYSPAVASVESAGADFGIVRVGDAVSARRFGRVTNIASGALQDTLHARLSVSGGPFVAIGSTPGLAAGEADSSSLQISLDTSTAGVFIGSATATFSSRNADLADLDIGAQIRTVRAQVNNLAAPAVSLTAGAGSFSGSGARYTLDFGTLGQGSGMQFSGLVLANATTGPADALSGTFDLGAGAGITLSGFDAFAGLAGGESLKGLTVGLNTESVGRFERTIVLHGISTNDRGPDLELPQVQLVLQGSVVAVPEPGNWLLMASGLLLVGKRLRRVPRAA